MSLKRALNARLRVRTFSTISPPPGSKASAVLLDVLSAVGGGGSSSSSGASSPSGTSSSSSLDDLSSSAHALPSNPYLSKVTYSAKYSTSKTNPSQHSFAQAGRYYNFGSAEEVASLFPEGVAGSIAEEWGVAGSNALLVRPLGVRLAKHLEDWRNTHGRSLHASGHPIKDLSADALKTAYVVQPLQEPPTRAEALKLGLLNAAPQGGNVATPPVTSSSSQQSGKDKTIVSSSSSSAAAAPVFTSAEAALFEKFRPVRVLTGPRGVGKSSILNYAAQYARLNGWICVFLSDSFGMMNMGKVLIPSKLRPGMVDQHDIALKLLRDLNATHSSQLAQIPQRLKYAIHRYLPPKIDAVVSAEREQLRLREEQEKAKLKAQADAAGKPWDPSTFVSRFEDESDDKVDRSSFTLQDMCSWGIKHPSAATDCLLHLLGELKIQTEFPILMAVDSINLLYGESVYPEAGSGVNLPSSRLSIPAAFQCLGADGFKPSAAFKRGMWLTAVSFTHTQDMKPMFEEAYVRGRVRVPVPTLTRQEVYSVLSHYSKSGGFLMLEGVNQVDPFLVEYYKTLCGGNYREIFRAAVFTPEPPAGPRNRNFRLRNN